MIKRERRQFDTGPRLRDHRQFVRLWTAASRRVHAYILTMVLNQADAEDILQEVGVTVWEKFDEYDTSRDFVPWACGIARFKVLSFNHSVNQSLVQSVELLEKIEIAVTHESHVLERQHQSLRACLSKLREAERHVLQLKYGQGYALKHVASVTGKSIQALYKSLQRIHLRLFDCVTRRLERGDDL